MSSWTAGLHDAHLSDRTDSYLDLRTGLLRNLLGATTREELVERGDTRHIPSHSET